jgi:hypothetical protein
MTEAMQESELHSLDFLAAQLRCNFVLFAPCYLPQRLAIAEQTFRPASAEAVATYRLVLREAARAVSIKQFLYDWAPPAYDHPSLWRRATAAREISSPTPYPVGDDIAWIGINYRGQRALSLNKMRTMIEMVVVEGSFSDPELVALSAGLRPVDSAAAENLSLLPFTSVTTHLHRPASAVPLSYWRHRRAGEWLPRPDSAPVKGRWTAAFEQRGYALDSSWTYRKGSQPVETEHYFNHRRAFGSTIRLLSFSGMPPLDDQICHCRNRLIGKRVVHHAFLSSQFGPHEAVWAGEEGAHLLLVKPATWTAIEWFDQLLEDLHA